MDTECSVLTTQLVTSMGFFWQLPVLSSCFLGKVVGRPLFEFGLKILMTSGWLSMGSCLLKQAHFLVQCCLPPPPPRFPIWLLEFAVFLLLSLELTAKEKKGK